MNKAVSVLFVVLGALFLGSAQEIRIQEVRFSGLQRTKASFLESLVKVQPGAVYQPEVIKVDIERLNRLPGIAKADFSLEMIQPERVILTYRIVENFTIIPGIRISQANNGDFAFRLSVFEFNFLGRNQILGGFYSSDVYNSYGVYWEAPYLLTNKLGFGINYQNNISLEPIYFERERTDYRLDRKTFEASLFYESNFHNNFELGVRFTNENYVIEGATTTAQRPEQLQAQKIIYTAEYENNYRLINYQYITGSRIKSSLAYSTGGTGLLNDRLIARTDFELFSKVGDKGNWASRLRLAYASFNASVFAPFPLDNQLNIRGVGNAASRSTAEVTINTEYRHTLYEKGWFVLQSNTFIDAGVQRRPNANFSDFVSRDNLKLSPGLGVRFIHKRIFNAVFRLDYGFGLGKNQASGLVFGIGQYF